MNEFKFKSAHPLSCNCDWIAPTISSRRWLNSSSYELYSLVSKSVWIKAPCNAERLRKRPLVSPRRAHDYKIAYVRFKNKPKLNLKKSIIIFHIDSYLTNVDVVIIKTVWWKSTKTVLASATTITNIAQLSVTAQVAVSTAIRIRHDIAAAAAVGDVTVRLCAETEKSAFYRRMHRK